MQEARYIKDLPGIVIGLLEEPQDESQTGSKQYGKKLALVELLVALMFVAVTIHEGSLLFILQEHKEKKKICQTNCDLLAQRKNMYMSQKCLLQ